MKCKIVFMNDQTLPTGKQFRKREPIATRQAQGRYANAPELDVDAARVIPKALVKFRVKDVKPSKSKA
jgi:hypothetical protein